LYTNISPQPDSKFQSVLFTAESQIIALEFDLLATVKQTLVDKFCLNDVGTVSALIVCVQRIKTIQAFLACSHNFDKVATLQFFSYKGSELYALNSS